MYREELNRLILELYYEDNLTIVQVINKIKKMHGLEIDKDTVNRTVTQNVNLEKTKKEQSKKYASIIASWLKRGYTIEQIKEEAAKIGIEFTENDIHKAEKMYEDWKKEHPNTIKSAYKCKKSKGEGR